MPMSLGRNMNNKLQTLCLLLLLLIHSRSLADPEGSRTQNSHLLHRAGLSYNASRRGSETGPHFSVMISNKSSDNHGNHGNHGNQETQQKTPFKCHCAKTNSCPENQDYCNSTGKCFASFELVGEGKRPQLQQQGCFDAHLGSRQCLNSPRHVVMCCEGDWCNSHLKPSDTPEVVPSDEPMALWLQLVLAVLLPVAFLLLVVPLVVLICRKQHKRRMHELEARERYLTNEGELLRAQHVGEETLHDMVNMSCTSGSGSGLPLLVQRTVARAVSLEECIGKGRYGEVWRAMYHGESVAVKVFTSRDEASWRRESEIYNTVLLRHENILGFFASDMTSRNSCTQLWLIVHYHENGSLYDYLSNHTISKDTALTFAHSAAAGLVHLHTEIFGMMGKPAIAHRDIKSKNILVKKNGQCCIADLGLAVMHSQMTNEIDVASNTKVGTKRYMAPELLSGAFQSTVFDAYKNLDVYSFGLVLWEIAQRCIVDPCLPVEEYRPPYFEHVPLDPSFEEMYKVVCEAGMRPEIADSWTWDETMLRFSQIMRECWKANPSARLTMLRVKKTLVQLRSSVGASQALSASSLSSNPPKTGSSTLLSFSSKHTT